MKLFRQLAIILLITFIGNFISTYFNMSIPGNVLGLIILLVLLCLGIVKLEMVEDVSNFLLDHLSFFFIPAGVGLITQLDLLKVNGIKILIVSIVSTIIVIIVTGHTIQLIKRRSN